MPREESEVNDVYDLTVEPVGFRGTGLPDDSPDDGPPAIDADAFPEEPPMTDAEIEAHCAAEEQFRRSAAGRVHAEVCASLATAVFIGRVLADVFPAGRRAS